MRRHVSHDAVLVDARQGAAGVATCLPRQGNPRGILRTVGKRTPSRTLIENLNPALALQILSCRRPCSSGKPEPYQQQQHCIDPRTRDTYAAVGETSPLAILSGSRIENQTQGQKQPGVNLWTPGPCEFFGQPPNADPTCSGGSENRGRSSTDFIFEFTYSQESRRKM